MGLHDAPTTPVRLPPAPRPASSRWLRWLHALDALTPPLLLAAMMIAARQRQGEPAAIGAIVIGGAVALGLGSIVAFFRDMSAAHIIWPVVFGVVAALLPLVALHMQFEHDAINAPVPVHLLANGFTWTALLVAICTLDGLILTTVAATPQWAGVAVMPVALLVGWLPVLALRATPDALYAAVLAVAVVSLVAVGVAWLLPERRRWFVIPVALGAGAATIWPLYARTPTALPGRWLFLIDLGLAAIASLIALGAPLLCRWLRAYTVGVRTYRPQSRK